MMKTLVKLTEPLLLFGHNQATEDPRDGLTLFGPLDSAKPYGIRAGVIGTQAGLSRFQTWVERIQKPIGDQDCDIARPPFPGFHAVFGIPWNPKPVLALKVSEDDLKARLYLDDKHQRVYQTVDLYASKILQALDEEEIKVDIWFVIIPPEVYKYCRPRSRVEPSLQIKASAKMSPRVAKSFATQPSIFEDLNAQAIPYQFEPNFHNQLKARLLGRDAPTQIIIEDTIAHHDFLDAFGRPTRDLDKLQSAIAWHIATAAFYKAGGRPWKMTAIRDGVCYIGIVFKKDDLNADPRASCCAAQMFLDSGDGVVFKGDFGPWYTPGRGDFHLSQKAARELVGIAVDSYKDKHGTEPPKQLFLHGKVRFNDDEWMGFRQAVTAKTNLVGVRIREDTDLKLYTCTRRAVLRGLAYVRDARTAYLWTRGFTPRLKTYPGREVPNPLLVDVCRGFVGIETVLGDIMALTKLNYNACIFADGEPVTLKFADAVGEVLSAGAVSKGVPLPFKYYI